MIYLQLFLAFLKIGFFGFGGGYAMLSLIQDETVVRYGWLTQTQLTDIVAISQMTPGPIAVNCATYAGYTVTGNVWGAILATFAVCLPALTLMLAAVIFFNRLKGNRYVDSAMRLIKPVTVAMIGAAALMFLTPETFPDTCSVIIFGAAALAAWFKVDSILLIALAAIAGIIIY